MERSERNLFARPKLASQTGSGHQVIGRLLPPQGFHAGGELEGAQPARQEVLQQRQPAAVEPRRSPVRSISPRAASCRSSSHEGPVTGSTPAGTQGEQGVVPRCRNEMSEPQGGLGALASDDRPQNLRTKPLIAPEAKSGRVAGCVKLNFRSIIAASSLGRDSLQRFAPRFEHGRLIGCCGDCRGAAAVTWTPYVCCVHSSRTIVS